MTRYTITVTRQQAQTLQTACEVLARLGIGQFRDALDHLPTGEFRPSDWHDDMDAIGEILSKHTPSHVDGDRTSAVAKDAWDLYQVIRHRLSWDAAIERGDIQPGQPRDWQKMMGVNYDTPMQTGVEALAQIVKD